jgi:hypothetical protein
MALFCTCRTSRAVVVRQDVQHASRTQGIVDDFVNVVNQEISSERDVADIRGERRKLVRTSTTKRASHGPAQEGPVFPFQVP